MAPTSRENMAQADSPSSGNKTAIPCLKKRHYWSNRRLSENVAGQKLHRTKFQKGPMYEDYEDPSR